MARRLSGTAAASSAAGTVGSLYANDKCVTTRRRHTRSASALPNASHIASYTLTQSIRRQKTRSLVKHVHQHPRQRHHHGPPTQAECGQGPPHSEPLCYIHRDGALLAQLHDLDDVGL